MSKIDVALYLFECHEPVDRSALSYKLDYMCVEGSHFEYSLETKDIFVLDDRIKITSSFTTENMGYSFVLFVNGSHYLSVLGNKQSWESSDPCILFTTPGGIGMQVSITDVTDDGLG